MNADDASHFSDLPRTCHRFCAPLFPQTGDRLRPQGPHPGVNVRTGSGVGADEIRTSTAIPGGLFTERQVEEYLIDENDRKILLAERHKVQAIDHQNSPEDIILFCLPDMSAASTGQNCVVEGGWILEYSRDNSRNDRHGPGRTSTGTGIARAGMTGGCATMRTAVTMRVSTRLQYCFIPVLQFKC